MPIFVADDNENTEKHKYLKARVFVRKDGQWHIATRRYVGIENDEETSSDWHPLDDYSKQLDSFDCYQDSSITINVDDLIQNNVQLKEASLSNYKILTDSAVGGSLKLDSTNIIYSPFVKYGNPSNFKYEITDNKGFTSTNLVNINVLRLKDIQAYIFNSSDLNTWFGTYTPPTLKEVYNTWSRISNNNQFYLNGVGAADEATSWEMISDSNFRCTVNSSYPTGFVSPNEYLDYTMEATLSSTNSDDDYIGLIIAFKRINGINHSLVVYRGMSSATVNTQSFRLVYITHETDTSNPTTTTIKTSNNWVIDNGQSNANSGNGWAASSPTRLRIERTRTGVICYTSPFNSTTLNKSVYLDLDFTKDDRFSWCLEPCNYGYICHSQNYSQWSDVIFNGNDLNSYEAYDFEQNCVWKFENGKWNKTQIRIQDELGWPRTVISATTGKEYYLEENEVYTSKLVPTGIIETTLSETEPLVLKEKKEFLISGGTIADNSEIVYNITDIIGDIEFSKTTNIKDNEVIEVTSHTASNSSSYVDISFNITPYSPKWKTTGDPKNIKLYSIFISS